MNKAWEDENKQETNPEQAIASASNFKELESVLDSLGPIKGSEEIYSPDSLIDKINRVQNGEIRLEYITRTHGLRDKVAELLGNSDLDEGESITGVESGKEDLYERMSQQPALRFALGQYFWPENQNMVDKPGVNRDFTPKQLEEFLQDCSDKSTFFKFISQLGNALEGRATKDAETSVEKIERAAAVHKLETFRKMQESGAFTEAAEALYS